MVRITAKRRSPFVVRRATLPAIQSRKRRVKTGVDLGEFFSSNPFHKPDCIGYHKTYITVAQLESSKLNEINVDYNVSHR